MPRYRLRTLLIVAAIAPAVLAVIASLATLVYVSCEEWIPGDEDPVDRIERQIRNGDFGYERDG